MNDLVFIPKGLPCHTEIDRVDTEHMCSLHSSSSNRLDSVVQVIDKVLSSFLFSSLFVLRKAGSL